MTGRRLPLSWSHEIRQSCSSRRRIYTMLDAAALASCTPIDLSDPSKGPDFMAVSFYKIFGYPDLGALVVRKDSAEVLQRRRYFGGGTVDFVTVKGSAFHAKRSSIHEQLEDGTLPFHNIIALDHAIDTHYKLYTSMKRISDHTSFLAQYMYLNLAALRHSNDQPLLRIYKDSNAIYDDARTQGATLAFNVYDSGRKLIPHTTIEMLADKNRIYIRSGALCNPRGFASYLNYTPSELRNLFEKGHRCSKPWSQYAESPPGVVRVSLGAMSTKGDVDVFVNFLRENILNRVSNAAAPITQLKLVSTRSNIDQKAINWHEMIVADKTSQDGLRVQIAEIAVKPYSKTVAVKASSFKWLRRKLSSSRLSPRSIS